MWISSGMGWAVIHGHNGWLPIPFSSIGPGSLLEWIGGRVGLFDPLRCQTWPQEACRTPESYPCDTGLSSQPMCWSFRKVVVGSAGLCPILLINELINCFWLTFFTRLVCNWSYTPRSLCLPSLPGHRRRGEWWPVPGVGHALHRIFWLLLDLIWLMLTRTGGGLIKGRNSVHLQACAARKFHNVSCMIGCNLNRCTYIRLPTCRSRLCLVACRGICRGDVATGGPLETGSLKIRLW